MLTKAPPPLITKHSNKIDIAPKLDKNKLVQSARAVEYTD